MCSAAYLRVWPLVCSAAPFLLWQGHATLRHALDGLAGRQFLGSHQEQMAYLQAKRLHAIGGVPAWACAEGAVFHRLPEIHLSLSQHNAQHAKWRLTLPESG